MAAGDVKTSMIIDKILKTCMEIEWLNAAVYEYFAKIFNNDTELTLLWEKTAAEERNHARQFELAINMRRDSIVDSLNMDEDKTVATLKIINDYYCDVRLNPPDIQTALKIAIKIEETLASCHMTTLANFSEERHRKLFRAMMAADQEHLETLQKTYHRYAGTKSVHPISS